MRQLRTLLRLKHGGAGLSDRTIACQIGVARSTIQEYLARVEAAGLSWPLPDDLTDEALDRLLFPRSGCRPGFRRRVEPDWAMVARELKRPGVTLMTLWEEYRESEPEGYGYSRFCDLFREFERHLSPVMRQHHVAGDKVFVDFSGKRLEVIDPTSGMVRPAEIFVGVLGASSYTYAEAVWTQTLPDWIGAHSRMFDFFGGVPRLVIPEYVPGHIFRVTCPSPLCDRASFYWEKWPDSFGTRPHNVQSAASHSSRALSSRHIGLRRNPTEAPVSGVQTCSIHQSGRSCSGGQSIAQHDNLHSAFVG